MAEKEKEEGLLKEVTERNIEHSLLKSRKIFLWSPVNDDSARAIVTRLLSLDAEDSETEIQLYINSPGGSVSDGLAIYDAMQAITCPVSTVCTGLAASMGAVLLAGGAKGRRFTWPHARIMIHQPLIMGTITGRATDLDIHAREMLKTREEINRLLASHTGQDIEKLAKDTDRDFYMSPKEAKEYGLIDDIVETTTHPKANGK
ncbi:MAG TPA: ATP-dependent Clp protease proteolytic subunit [Candidatus Latescibacteria bacterium]|jgi:ATP-dependent Clp protease protease subunit|nr:ATP-dependent Clp protease proteolytic subunit [Candidatus Latescibacterota bacterium]MEC8992894.1 ATP-dependent Clp protease proteolytic subunit [Candidatus Latescibacterota bacterium]MED5414846.1 ATP-dependent Clp protease proteolytic subunit [Candidatus Latescibacterota bacterium]MEE3338289.1 ATP-dependent Clp protease proteolytic subunit [Candidatus Latescibacterota bacterium]HCV23453.1 ATP-dependent Clp protease proteolytic subunit [Candidatus Latescibacterota bacterium]|tara:strand:- start:445 stop:1053 length:609 start_codon:yes stop_codon:yes gene_type:complete